MEDFLEQNPCVRLIAPFIIGIIIGSLFSVPIKVSVTIAVIAIGIAIWLYNRLLKYTQRWLPGFVSGIAILAVGMLLITTHQNCQTDEPTTRTVDQYRACVLNPPALKNRYYKTELQIEAANISGSWYSIDTKITATIERDSLAENLKAGQTIEFAAQIDSLNAPKNPFGFDYANYLQNNGIHGSIFLKSGKWQIVSAEVRGISRYALNIRQRLIGLFKDAGLSGNELGLASTLVLGYKNDIDSEVKQAYMNAGAMHVLAVSGMHVGIVYMALDLLMIVFGGKRLYWLKQLLIILLLWAYAFITGLSPSVTRATIMFTVVIFGKVFNRDTSVYNSLAFAALCILVYDPSMLFKPSFQLSCVAVTGIVFYQPRIARIINVKNKALNYLWQLTSVSIAAQIATLPFCLYYFERTPVYFWLSNIIVSPGATMLIVLAMLLLITSPINCISTFFGFLTKWATKAMNFLVITIANLPGSTIENTHIAVIQAIA
ncbi:MAG: ComEC/Rec2 family competence protein, partial [Salinivirgaceae bacterium]|nr:ComEC/Rec2 family competence protein [Salinivirgaceae bacterium]